MNPNLISFQAPSQSQQPQQHQIQQQQQQQQQAQPVQIAPQAQQKPAQQRIKFGWFSYFEGFWKRLF